MRRLIFGVWMVIALLAAGCTSQTVESDDDPIEEVDPEDGGGEETVPDDDGGGDDGIIVPDASATPPSEELCVYRPDLLFVSIDQQVVINGATLLDADAVAELIGTDDAAGAAETIVGAIQVFDTGDLDALALAIELQEQHDVIAAPVLAYGLAGHWGFAPAQEREDFDDFEPDEPETETDEPQLYAVIDTGLVDTGFNWIDDHVGGDPEPEPLPSLVAGHGTFIASIIRQQNPESEVYMQQLPPTTAELMIGGDEIAGITDGIGTHDHAGEVFVSDELQLLAAAITVASRVQNPAGLVISGGSYECEGLTVNDVLSAEALGAKAAVDHWVAQHPPAPIAAAAGNDANSTHLFLPAAFPDVNGIGSVDQEGNTSAFSNNADLFAPGEGLIGVADSNGWVSWSGTSFAAPLWLAAGVSGDLDPSAVSVSFR